MPYRVKGKTVFTFKEGKWIIKQITKTPEVAKSVVRLLRAVNHGWKPTRYKKTK